MARPGGGGVPDGDLPSGPTGLTCRPPRRTVSEGVGPMRTTTRAPRAVQAARDALRVSVALLCAFVGLLLVALALAPDLGVLERVGLLALAAVALRTAVRRPRQSPRHRVG